MPVSILLLQICVQPHNRKAYPFNQSKNVFKKSLHFTIINGNTSNGDKGGRKDVNAEDEPVKVNPLVKVPNPVPIKLVNVFAKTMEVLLGLNIMSVAVASRFSAQTKSNPFVLTSFPFIYHSFTLKYSS